MSGISRKGREPVRGATDWITLGSKFGSLVMMYRTSLAPASRPVNVIVFVPAVSCSPGAPALVLFGYPVMQLVVQP